jgi:hypothetical protein
MAHGKYGTCSLDEWYNVMRRKNRIAYAARFCACPDCFVMFVSPTQFSDLLSRAPDIEMSMVVSSKEGAAIHRIGI